MKILVEDLSSHEHKKGWDELGILKVIQESDFQFCGYCHVCQLLDIITRQGPNGNHTCLVLEEKNLSVLDRSLPGPISLPLLKRVSKRTFQYLHEERGII